MYKKFLEDWIQEEMAKGLPWEDAYRSVSSHVDELHKALVKTRREKENLDFREYVMHNGFQHDGQWYIRTTWLRPTVRKSLEKMGIISRAGRASDLKGSRIEVPYTLSRNPTSIFYRVDLERLQIQ